MGSRYDENGTDYRAVGKNKEFLRGCSEKKHRLRDALAFSQVQEEMSKSLLGHWNIEVDSESWKNDFHSFIDPFGSNGNIATVKQMQKVCRGLDNAFAMIDKFFGYSRRICRH